MASSRTFGIDTRWAESKVAAAGTKSYIESMVRAMLELDHTNRYHLWGAPLEGVTAPNAHNDQFMGKWRRAWQLVWKTVGWPTVDLVGPKVDLWHFTNYVAPPTHRPFVLSVLDLSFVKHPEFTEPKNLAYLRRFVPDSLERADQIIAISESTRDALIEEFKVPLDKVSVTHLACDQEYFAEVPEEEQQRIRDKHGIEGDYFLAVGTLEPRKNLKNLLMAFAAMRKHTDEQLVVIGGHGWLFDETEELLRKLGLGNRVILTGYLPKREMPALYQGAKLFVFPSFYEGFGIPVLEAMASGTPVACSNTSSLPEVAGTAALYFDPEDTKGMRLAIQRCLDDAQLRDRLAEAGREQAAQFSWERTAQETLAVYERVLQIRARRSGHHRHRG